MVVRVETRHRVNFELLKVFKIYTITSKQVLGNLVMLLPLGIYLPLLYRKLSGFFAVAIVSMLVSVFIELLQLVTSYRSTDIDDVLLNTTGACAGFMIYTIVKAAYRPAAALSPVSPAIS